MTKETRAPEMRAYDNGFAEQFNFQTKPPVQSRIQNTDSFADWREEGFGSDTASPTPPSISKEVFGLKQSENFCLIGFISYIL